MDATAQARSFDLYMEGGSLHYFADLNPVADLACRLLRPGGRLVLNDFHPFRKCIKEVREGGFKGKEQESKEGRAKVHLELGGNYLNQQLRTGPVAYQGFFPEEDQADFPQCSLRIWTFGRIITAFATAGLAIERVDNGPHYIDDRLPGDFTLVAHKAV